MDSNPKTERETLKKNSVALRAFQKCGGLLGMSREELKYMPKEVMIACAADEIAYVWDKLPEKLRNDIDVLKYQYCLKHYNNNVRVDGDTIDGPPPRRLFCCYCNIEDISVDNTVEMNVATNGKKKRNRGFCLPHICKLQ